MKTIWRKDTINCACEGYKMKTQFTPEPIKYSFSSTCDVCGKKLKDPDEMVCRECKTKAKQAIKKVEEERDE